MTGESSPSPATEHAWQRSIGDCGQDLVNIFQNYFLMRTLLCFTHTWKRLAATVKLMLQERLVKKHTDKHKIVQYSPRKRPATSSAKSVQWLDWWLIVREKGRRKISDTKGRRLDVGNDNVLRLRFILFSASLRLMIERLQRGIIHHSDSRYIDIISWSRSFSEKAKWVHTQVSVEHSCIFVWRMIANNKYIYPNVTCFVLSTRLVLLKIFFHKNNVLFKWFCFELYKYYLFIRSLDTNQE